MKENIHPNSLSTRIELSQPNLSIPSDLNHKKSVRK